MSRLLHPWADVAPGDTHAIIADDSDCLLMAAMAATRHQQHLFVLAEPQAGRGIVFGPDGTARGTQKEGLKPIKGLGPSQGTGAAPAAAALRTTLAAAPAAAGGAAVPTTALAARSSAPPASPSSSSSAASAFSTSSSASSSSAEGPALQWWQKAAAAADAGSTYNCFSVDALRELWHRELPFMSSGRSEVSSPHAEQPLLVPGGAIE